MHLLGVSLLLTYLLYNNLATDFSDDNYYYEYLEQEQPADTDFPPEPDMEQKLRSASSVDELMSLIYPSYWAATKCRSKLSAATTAASGLSQRSRGHRPRPFAHPEEPTFAAAFFNMDILKSIESEWRKTQCTPREVCVDVSREFGAPNNIFYKPPCVSVYRCGGCCQSEDKQCRNISSSYVSKTRLPQDRTQDWKELWEPVTGFRCFGDSPVLARCSYETGEVVPCRLFEITVPITQGTKPVTISVANHTHCSCLSKLDIYKQVHSIIRRALPECQIANSTCPAGERWSSRQCGCVSVAPSQQYEPSPPPPTPPRLLQDNLDMFSKDVCGPHKELDVESCQCVCRHRAPTHDCGPNRHRHHKSCQCVCNLPPSALCPLNYVFNKETCQCTCSKTCPRQQPLNKTKCSCECNESPNKCFLKGRRFHQATCRCLRAPCEVRHRRCESGFSFREEVCRCVPSHWTQLD